jgi:beta-1,4-N-acetylglucosaminyltransferase
MIALLSSLDFDQYYPRTYVLCAGDSLSVNKAIALEENKAPANDERRRYKLLIIPRARRVHQSLLTTPPTALVSLLSCIYHMTLVPMFSGGYSRGLGDILLVNGPGTCFVLCGAAYINKFLGLPAPKLIYVESFARVQSLSLSGRLLRPFVDRFIVQWPEVLRSHPNVEYRGWLV